MDEDVTDMAEELGIAPASDVDDRQRYELLRSWHEEDAKREADEKSDR
jgi:hypothetical protein